MERGKLGLTHFGKRKFGLEKLGKRKFDLKKLGKWKFVNPVTQPPKDIIFVGNVVGLTFNMMWLSLGIMRN